MENKNLVSRLQSLKLPRDLNLGLQKPKKQYTPNLNVVRNKDKPKELFKKEKQKREQKTQNKGKHDNKSRYIQTTGVFSQGMGIVPNVPKERRVNYGLHSSSSNKTRTSQSLFHPNVKIEGIKPEVKKWDSESDDDENAELKGLTLLKFPQVRSAIKSEIKKEIKEDDDDDDVFMIEANVPDPFNTFSSRSLSDENLSLGVVALPDSFPDKGFSDDPNCTKLYDYPLSAMSEGQIGKLVIRKSGKMEVQIGKNTFQFKPDDNIYHRTELASIVQGDDQSHQIAIVGKVVHSYSMVPDVEKLLK